MREQGDALDALSAQQMVDLRAKLQTLFDQAPKALAASMHVQAASFPGLELPQQREEVLSALTNRFALPSAETTDTPLYCCPTGGLGASCSGIWRPQSSATLL